MTWNYRVFKKVLDEEIILEVHEVYYNTDGSPRSYSISPVSLFSVDGKEIDAINGLKWQLEKFQEALQKPFLTEEDF